LRDIRRVHALKPIRNRPQIGTCELVCRANLCDPRLYRVQRPAPELRKYKVKSMS